MSACNAVPSAGHPLAGSLTACHMHADHDGPHTWELEPSKARRGIDKLLAVFANREIEKIDSQLTEPIEVYDIVDGRRAAQPYRKWDLPTGPWVTVHFVGGDRFAIWKATGAVYRVGHDGAVEEDPILELQ